jgi:intergrase/recombinase
MEKFERIKKMRPYIIRLYRKKDNRVIEQHEFSVKGIAKDYYFRILDEISEDLIRVEINFKL